ncbi:TPA: hypothetical protein OZJ01_002587 [Staphylococcus aureus]|nr:hypothetical protein [Staphylococcus aureus]HCX3044042.1 hypothetical protein [Staphylococcus aureus]HCX3573792.1 hypothetical protein [Staphylococcus aureus]
MTMNNIVKINNHQRYDRYSVGGSEFYTSDSIGGNLAFKKVEGGNMSYEYITRPEFEEHKRHLDTRFDKVEDSIKKSQISLSKDIDLAIKNLKDEINDKKLTSNRFWIGIAAPTVVSIIGIIIGVFFK